MDLFYMCVGVCCAPSGNSECGVLCSPLFVRSRASHPVGTGGWPHLWG